MKKLVITAVVCLFSALTGFAGIEIQLDFSTDGGKTWSEDFPILKKENPRCKVRAKFQVSTEDESEKPLEKVVKSELYSETCDFASANKGRWKFKEMDCVCWFQTLKVYYRNISSKVPFIYDLDLGERKEDTMGIKNKWEKGKGFVDAPLPACNPLPPGTYKFHVRIRYRTESQKMGINSQAFDGVISE